MVCSLGGKIEATQLRLSCNGVCGSVEVLTLHISKAVGIAEIQEQEPQLSALAPPVLYTCKLISKGLGRSMWRGQPETSESCMPHMYMDTLISKVLECSLLFSKDLGFFTFALSWTSTFKRHWTIQYITELLSNYKIVSYLCYDISKSNSEHSICDFSLSVPSTVIKNPHKTFCIQNRMDGPGGIVNSKEHFVRSNSRHKVVSHAPHAWGCHWEPKARLALAFHPPPSPRQSLEARQPADRCPGITCADMCSWYVEVCSCELVSTSISAEHLFHKSKS